MQSDAISLHFETRRRPPSYSRPLVAGILLLAMLTVTIFFSGCTTTPQGKDPVLGTWEWSDGKGYSERYIFGPDHSFYAQALGSEFNGTWETASPDHYQVTYRNRNDVNSNETLTEQMLYDSKTDEIYFPPHHRIV